HMLKMHISQCSVKVAGLCVEERILIAGALWTEKRFSQRCKRWKVTTGHVFNIGPDIPLDLRMTILFRLFRGFTGILTWHIHPQEIELEGISQVCHMVCKIIPGFQVWLC